MSLEPALRSVLSAEYDVSDDFTSAASGAPNRARGLLSRGAGGDAVLGDYRLDEDANQAWYMVGQRQFVVLMLESQQTPMVDTATLDRRDGVAMRCLYDARVANTGYWRIYRSQQ